MARFHNAAFTVDCSNSTLRQLVATLQRTGKLFVRFPDELAATPVTVVVQGQPLEKLLQTALGQFNYILSESDSTEPSTAMIVGLRGVSTGEVSAPSPVQAASTVGRAGPDSPPPSVMPSPQTFDQPRNDPGVVAGPTPGLGVKVLAPPVPSPTPPPEQPAANSAAPPRVSGLGQ